MENKNFNEILEKTCCKCGSKNWEEQFSLGIYAGRYCEKCWEKSGYRKEGAESFNELDAGETY